MSARRRNRTTGSTPSGVTRREFITRGGATLGGLALAPALLSSGSAFAAAQTDGPGGKVNVLNWPLYIDKKSKKDFTKTTGVALKYNEGINDNNEFFAKYQEELSQNRSIGFDIVIPTSWMAQRLIDLGYVQKLPLGDIPNAANLSPGFQNPLWDPTGEYSLPWQTGITGIAYNLEATGRELTSINDLFDKEFKGKIGVLSEMRDTMGLMALSEGIDPATITFAQAKPAFKKLEKASNSGQIRRFTGNDYQDDLVAGNFAACIGWSGDVAQLLIENDNLRFVIPDEGGMRWADTMLWVTPSDNSDGVAAWMNYFYDPTVAARVANFVQYISPVDGIKEALAEIDPVAAESELIFPTEETQARLKTFGALDSEEEEKFDNRFAEIAGA
ncbi:MAG: spermidine/putrescine ABC transporter substrate-binding protein [Acidimicrobiia bacterium]